MFRRWLFFGVLILLLALISTSSAQEKANPFGLMIGGGARANTMPVAKRLELAAQLGVAYFRPFDVTVADWTGQCEDPACEAASEQGLGLILTVRSSRGGATLLPSRLPRNLEAYKQTLGEILDTYKPALLVVENEETSAVFWEGSAEQYGDLLGAACEVAHERDIPCANGGIVSGLLGVMLWAYYTEQGKYDVACDFAQRAMDDAEEAETICGIESVDDMPQRPARALERGQQFLETYAQAGVDYINFHWYIADGAALKEAVNYLREVTGLPVITNEIGLPEQNAEAVSELMSRVLSLNIPYAVWYSLDRPGAVALTDLDGTLRPNGEAFLAFIQEHFGE